MNVNYISLSSGRDTWLKNGIGDLVGLPPGFSSKFLKRKWLVSLVMLLCLTLGQNAWSQSAANYTFSTSTAGSLALDKDGNAIDMSTGTTQLYGGGVDGYTNPGAQNFGFTFYFMGAPFTQWNANPDGQIRLGSTLLTGHTSTAASGASYLIASNIDAKTDATTGKVHYKVQAGTGGQVLIVEWKNLLLNWSATGTTLSTFQARVYQTGAVEYVYGQMWNSSTSAQTTSIGFATGVSAGTIGQVLTINATPTYSSSALSLTTTSFTASSAMTNLNSSADGSRRVFSFTPVNATAPADPTTLTFSAVGLNATTVNWVDNSTNEVGFLVTRATDAGFTTNVTTTSVASTSSATTGTAYNSLQSSLSPGTTYYYKVQAIVEAAGSTGITGSQATTAGATYYWVGASGSTWGLASNWNTNPAGGGTTRTTVATTDVLIVDGAGTTPGGSLIISHDVASPTIGQFKVTSNTNLTLQSSTTTTRTTTISGGGGDDFVIEAGSTLNLSNAANAAAFAFSGTANTGLIAGTYNASGSTSNVITTTGGTGTLVTVTGSVNNNIVGSSGCMTGSTATLAFAAGSNYSHGSFTTTNGFIPLATWDTTSTVTITGGTTSTGITNPAQSFGNFVYNSTTSTGTQSVWTSGTTAVIKGNLTITATGTGIFRAVTSGTVTVNGNVNINGGTFQSGNGTTSTNGVVVLGNTNIGAAGTLNINSAFYSQRGTTFTNDGTITGTASASTLQFFSPTNVAQTFAGTGTVLTNIGTMSVQNTSGLTITHTNQIPLLRVNLFNGAVTNSNKITFGTGAALNTTVQIGYAGNVLAGGSFDAAPTFNLGTGTHGVIYAQELAARTTGFEIPSSRALGFLTQTNSNGLTIAGGNLSATTLTFNALSGGNINTNSSNVLTVTGTTTGSIVRTLATAYVNGPLALTLPASLVTGSTYTFPIGKSTLNTFSLVNPTTNAGGTVTVQAEAFDGNSGGTPGFNISAISTTKYWAASITNGAANFTDTLIQLNDSPTGRDAIAASSTVNGAYDIQGGVTVNTTATTMETTAPKNTTLPGFFLMGNKAAASLANLTITPSTTQCVSTARTVTVEVTPGGAAVTGVVINYSVNGVAQTAITMTNTTGNGGFAMDVWSGVIPAVTPSNATVAWSVTATDGNGLVKTQSGTSYQDDPLFSAPATATASVSSYCGTGSSVLTASMTNTVSGIIGTATTLTSATTQPTAFCNRWPSYRMQLVYTAAELAAAGLTAGNITSMAFNITTLGDGATNSGFVVKMGHTALSTLSGDFQATTGFTEVYPSQTYTHTATGWQTIPFSTPFVWNGTSNIIIDMVHNGADATNNATTYYTATAGNTVAYTSTAATNSASFSTNRLNITLTNVVNFPITSVSWSNGDTGLTTTVSPTSTTTYTATITSNGCTKVTNPVTVTVNPVPTAPAEGVTTHTCGTGVPLVSVTDPNAFTTPTFKWYADNVTTTALQSSTSTTYTSSISTTTNFYVSVVDPATGCESARTLIVAFVDTPDAIDTIANQTVCIGQSFTVTASSLNAAYTYSWSSTAGSGASSPLAGTTQTITPTVAGTYTYTVTGTDGICTTTTTFTATVTPYPVLTSATASPAAVCANGVSTLTATYPTSLLFSTSTGASLDPMTGATTVLTTNNDDDVTVSPSNIGFSFVFNGVSYSQYSVSPDGWIMLGSGTASNQFTNSTTSTSNIPKLYPYWDDLATGTTGSVKTLVTGTAPNRIFIVQWNVTIPRAVSGAANSTFQAWLYETTNVIEYRYGTMGAQTSNSISAGYTISGTNYNSITFSSNSNSTTTANDANNSVPASGRMYTFTPPTPPTITWAPTTDLYTDAAATTAYTGGSASVVYSKPTETRTYYATVAGTNGCDTVSGAITVTQNAEAVDAITGGSTSVCLGTPTIPASVQFVSSVGVEWISSNPAVATIDVDGILTPLTAGTTTISARIVNTTTGCTSYAPNTVSVNVYAPLAITTNPSSVNVLEYNGVDPTTTTFTVAASGSVSGYQWEVSPTGAEGSFSNVSGAEFSGMNTATLTIANATTALNGLYFRCQVSGQSPCATPLASANALLTVSSLSITDPVFGAPICGTGDRNVSITVTGGTPDAIVWLYSDDNGANYNIIDGSPIGGISFTGDVNSSTLEMVGISATNNGWKLIAVAALGSTEITSNPTTIVVNTPHTVETTGPGAVQDVTICGNAAATSTFLVSGSGSISGFQWQYSSNGADWDNVAAGLPTGASYTGANGSLLTVNTTSALSAGPHYYRCRVSGALGCDPIDSNTAQLIVTSPTIIANSSSSLICNPGGSAVTLTASGAGVGGTYVWSPTTGLTGTGDTVSANPSATTTYTVTGTTSAGCSSTATVTVTVGTTPVVSIIASETTVCPGTLVNLDASSVPSGGTAPTYCAALNSGSSQVNSVTFNTLTNSVTQVSPFVDTYPATGTTTTSVVPGQTYALSVTTDAASIASVWIDYNHDGTFSATEHTQLWTSASSGTVNITIPANAVNGATGMRIRSRSTGSANGATDACTQFFSGSTQNYTITIGSTAGYTYSWTSNPAGFTSTSAVVSVTPTETTTYSVLITTPLGCSYTSTQTITTQSGAAITTQPADTSVCEGATATLSVVATGANVTYQWRKGGVDMFGEISSTLTIPAATSANAGTYDVVVTPSCGSPVTSNPAVLTVNPIPTATAPSAQTACSGVTTTAIPLVGTPSGVTFNISGGAAIGLANVTGVTEIPSFTTIAGSATISVTPVANGCTGSAVTFTYTVNATPATPTAGSNSPACTNGNINLTASAVTINGYSMNSNSGVAFIDINTTGTSVGTVSDDSEHNITIPSFTFNGVAYTTARVGMNGAIVFGSTTGDVGVTNVTMPTTSMAAGNAFLAPLWDDLDIQSGASIKTQTVGNLFIIQYTAATHDALASTTDSVTFQVQLNTVTGAITYVYPDVTFGNAANDFGLTATVGIQWSTTGAVQYSSNTASLLNGQSITFTPNTATYSWTGPNGFTSSVQNPTLPATAEAAGTYTVYVTNPATGCSSASSSTTVVVDTATTWYADADGDTYGNAAVSQMACSQPSGYVSNNTDCDDTNAAIYQFATYFVDADADGYTNGTASVCSGTSAPAGYSATSAGTDCNDANAAVYQSSMLYVDADGDGYTVGAASSVCYGASIPTGYSATSAGEDCDDTNASITVGSTYYADADGDGYGNAAVSTTACTAPSGYVSNNTDCDDTNISIYQYATFYVDADGDGWDNGTASVCSGATAPAGYSATTSGTDCNDTNPLLTDNCTGGSVVNLTMFIQGYYIGGNTMNPVKFYQDGVSADTDVEDLTIELHDATTYDVVDTAIATLHTDGTLSATFNTAAAGDYFISVRGVNMLETWSATAQTVGTTPLNYDMSAPGAIYTDGSQASSIEVEPGVWAAFSGDINLDGSIDLSDVNPISNDSDNSAYGVLATDLTGDGSVDLSDVNTASNNSDNSIYAQRPY